MSAVPTLEPAAAYALWAQAYPPHAHNPVMLAEERAMLALMPGALQGQHVLDAGCGSGRYMLHALRRGALHVTGVDLSLQMLQRAGTELARDWPAARVSLQQGSLDKLPLPDAIADLSVCGLVVGHLQQLWPALEELHRVTRVGGIVLCSDVHPIGHALGWRRDFKADGRQYAVRHTQHLYSHWHTACASLGLAIEAVAEPMLDPADIPPGARFDQAALQVPVALVMRLRRIA
ncbi:class I SAM-dependent methyltransferase [Xanthomonas hortorum pv. vitians]|uniref:2-methoxy-6-polyprenyl-1,4-benzoquinol methylase, mitochondrial n=1 Tax=Xanthomonas hortorum pv. vitians TaxID=83224 RepID=A0A6V7EGE1_9XANT|nr:class I SAM-dependent methyltransferase [Xanthomonas hortorum]APP85208.1 biotin synthase [Xanthomonas hortorum pv. gardneri]ASW44863.1 biotin synthase [Xanthomonas hortorum]MCC8492935.1 class I SAM-dependent methyltransferase [Xanthomonas hortorum pv. gardneri]MCE4282111.1 class I SAM-dependent methyltransferase [Xanthomonas hortorum pv. vitians]MCE4287268.1 class I SAM-dependent methyltransferase [Xanthomonas hortorum pv. vitians]